MHRIIIEIESEINKIIFNALRYEEAPRAKIKFYMKGKKLFLEIEASSISNLRAACNSFIKWIDMVEKISEKFKIKNSF